MTASEASSLFSGLAPWLEGMKMSFQSIHFMLFLPLAVGIYFVLRGKARRVWLLLASYYFYFFAAPKYLPVLLLGTLFSYFAARRIAAAPGPRSKRNWLAFGIVGLVLGLAFFKYNRLFSLALVPLFQALGLEYTGGFFTTAGALGISFYSFVSIGYLIDLARGDVPLEKSLLSHALFLGFFPSVVSGPISRAGQLLPQLNDTARRFDPAAAPQALRRMATGFFKKLAVADTLAVFVDAVYQNSETLAAHSGLTLSLAAVAFALQLYFDFSGYTDIAVGTAGLLGIRLPENFKNPYFATNFSTFWQRWHISLTSWLQDYIFTPLVWSRWTEKLPGIGKRIKNPPVLSSILIVFAVSGLWHGDTWCYLIWGLLQAVYRIGEELLHRWLGKPKKNPGPGLRFGKRALVLVLWVESLVFFRAGRMPAASVADAAGALLRQFTSFSPGAAWQTIVAAPYRALYANTYFVYLFLAFGMFCLALALLADWAEAARWQGQGLATRMGRWRALPRWLVYYLLTLACFAGFLLQSGGYAGASFLYGGY